MAESQFTQLEDGEHKVFFGVVIKLFNLIMIMMMMKMMMNVITTIITTAIFL